MDPTNVPATPAVPAELLSDVQAGLPAAAAPAPAVDPGGNGAPALDPGTVSRVEAASASAVAQHLAASPARRRGQRGPDKSPRRPRLPLAEVGNGAVPVPPLAEDSPVPLAPFVEVPPPFDRELAEAGAELTTEIANDTAATLMEWYALHQLGNDDLARAAGEKARMKEGREKRIRRGIVSWAERNPEKAAKFFGGLLIFDPLCWLGEIGKQAAAIRAQGAALRAEPKAA